MRSLAPRLTLGDTRFVTFTIKHNRKPLKDQIDKLYKDFNNFRRESCWKKTQRGAAAFLEVKIGRDGLWHPHLHVLTLGTRLEAREVRKTWLKITGDSKIVDMQQPNSLAQVRWYVTKYITKPLDHSILSSPERLAEAIKALKGRRVCNSSGEFGRIIAAKPPETLPDDWITVDRLDQLLKDAKSADPIALEILNSVSFRIDSHRHRKKNTS